MELCIFCWRWRANNSFEWFYVAKFHVNLDEQFDTSRSMEVTCRRNFANVVTYCIACQVVLTKCSSSTTLVPVASTVVVAVAMVKMEWGNWYLACSITKPSTAQAQAHAAQYMSLDPTQFVHNAKVSFFLAAKQSEHFVGFLTFCQIKSGLELFSNEKHTQREREKSVETIGRNKCRISKH